MSETVTYNILQTPLPTHHLGPHLDRGPRPSVFYFALSGEESLNVSPYNQPAILLAQAGIRVFSWSLPFHGPDFDNLTAINSWVKEIESGNEILKSYVKQCQELINFLINENLVNPSRLGTAGLSRGGFIASHLAAIDERIKVILGFAPVTDLSIFSLKETYNPSLSLFPLIDELARKQIRYHIGNRDVRVSTSRCFAHIEALANAAYAQGIRSPPIELVISPSIGHKGHGTPPEVFSAGADWMKQKLLF